MGGWYSFFKTVFVRPAVKWWFRVQIEGTEKLPQGGCLLAGNHLDAGDTFTLPSLIKPKVTFPAKKELFEGKGLKGRAVAWFLRAVGQAPIDRSGGRQSVAGLGSVTDVLLFGGVVGIFPARGAPMGACTRAIPGWRGWRWRPNGRCCRSL